MFEYERRILMNPYNLDITRIVKYFCMSSVAIVGIIMGCVTFMKVAETHIELLNDSWNDEK